MEFFVVLFGLSFGSFFNVCIYRIPHHVSLLPSSKCPACKHIIKWYHNIPVLSYLFLKGKCSYCGHKIPAKYPIVELVTALFFLFLYWNAGLEFSLDFFRNLTLFSLGIIIFFIDFEHKIIPDVLSILMLVSGIIFSLFPASSLNWQQSLLGGFGGFILFLSVAYVCHFLLKKECLGGGDIKLIAGLGAYLGIYGVFIAIFFASIIAIVVLIAIRYDLKKTFPFGPFLIIGALFYQFFGSTLIRFYLSLWRL